MFQLLTIMMNAGLGFGSTAHSQERAEEMIDDHVSSPHHDPVKFYMVVGPDGAVRYYDPQGVYLTSYTFKWSR